MKSNETQNSGSSSLPKVHYFWLDWLRFSAAFVVVICHARGSSFVEYGRLEQKYHSLLVATAFAFSRVGQEAVILFFVLSGFLVGGRSLQRAINQSFSLFCYSIDRVTRIYMPLLPALVLTACLLLYRGENLCPLVFCGNLVGLNGVFVEDYGGNSPLWSLAFEIWFYVMWGSVLGLTTLKKRLARAIAWLLILASLAVFTRLQPLFLFCWLLGVLGTIGRPANTKGLKLLVAGFIIVCATVILQLSSDTVSLNVGLLNKYLPSDSISILILASGYVMLLRSISTWRPQRGMLTVFERSGTLLASWSYSLYLTHFPVLNICELIIPGRSSEVSFTSVSIFVLRILVCIIFGIILYYFFERKTGIMRKWLHKIFMTSSSMHHASGLPSKPAEN